MSIPLNPYNQFGDTDVKIFFLHESKNISCIERI